MNEPTPRETRSEDHDPDIQRVQAVLAARLLGDTPTATKIGRFVVLDRIGAGAMGVVFAAFDPELDRKVAIKLLFHSDADEHRRARMLGEARALAKLAHPNVVGIFEVGEYGDRVFIAMEYIRGRTLRAWATERTRAWQQVLATCLQAGRGLAAAHAEGIVHRDFKPDNVLVGDDAQAPQGVRARVLDFGLARHALPDREPSLADEASESDDDSTTRLTRTGARVGTPAYMAPEQFASPSVDESADQFAFCVTLFECLYGARPFAASSVPQLVEAVTTGRMLEPPRDRAVPGWVHRVIARGLSIEPRDRWPSMNALLDALARDPSRSRTRWIFGGVAVGLVGIAALGARTWLTARAQQCTGAAEQLAGVWDDARRAEVEGALAKTGVAFAAQTWTSSAAVLDGYADDWSRMYVESCTATAIRGEQSHALMDLRTGCLQRARVRLDAAIGVLADADAEVVRNAHVVVGALPSLARCADVDALQADVEPPPAAQADAVAEVRSVLARAEAERDAGRYASAQADVDEAELRTRELDYGPLQAEVALDKGLVLRARGKYDDSAAALRQAFALATRWNLRDAMRIAAVNLHSLLGAEQNKFGEALQFRELALALASTPADEAVARQHIGGVLDAQGTHAEAEAEFRRALELVERSPDHRQVVRVLHTALGGTLYFQGRFAEAELHNREALALSLEQLGPEHPDIAGARQNLAIAFAVQGKHAEAEEQFKAVLASLEEKLGPEHPEVAQAHNNLGTLLEAQGRYAEAEDEVRKALLGWETSLGPEHPDVALARKNLGAVLYAAGRFPESLIESQRALAIWSKILGPDAPECGSAHEIIGAVLQAERKFSEAEIEYRRALELIEKALGPDHQGVAAARLNLGSTLAELGKLTDAETELRKALSILEAALDDEQPYVAQAQTAVAKVIVDQGRAAEAVVFAEKAWARLQRDDVPVEVQAEAAFVLARSTWESASDDGARARARELATSALTAFGKAPTQYAANTTIVRDWLEAHQPTSNE